MFGAATSFCASGSSSKCLRTWHLWLDFVVVYSPLSQMMQLQVPYGSIPSVPPLVARMRVVIQGYHELARVGSRRLELDLGKMAEIIDFRRTFATTGPRARDLSCLTSGIFRDYFYLNVGKHFFICDITSLDWMRLNIGQRQNFCIWGLTAIVWE